jgi:hypothetical protein
MEQPDGWSAGERLLRSEGAAGAARACAGEVARQVEAALLGPFAGVLSAATPAVPASSLAPGSPAAREGAPATPASTDAAALLTQQAPRRFIAAGAAFTLALSAVASGDETRAAGALLCAQQTLFPQDPAGARSVASACRPALERLRAGSYGWTAPPETPQLTPELIQQRVAAGMAALERAYQAAAPGVEEAALNTASWRAMVGGFGAASGVARAQFGPFVDGLVRWAFFVEAALDAIRHDDWAAVGACLMAARQDVQRGSGGATVQPL